MGSGLVCERCYGDVMERRQQQEDNICWGCWQQVEPVCGQPSGTLFPDRPNLPDG